MISFLHHLVDISSSSSDNHDQMIKDDNEVKINPNDDNPMVDQIDNELPVPNTWKQCEQWITNHVLCEEGANTLIRLNTLEKKYAEQRTYIRKYYLKYSDYIKHKIFMNKVHEIEVTDSETVKLKAIDVNKPQAVLINNDFGYHLEKGVAHLVLFSTEALELDQINEIIDAQYPGKQYLWWRNPVHRQSIPDVWHVQVLVDLRIQSVKHQQTNHVISREQ
eukprot:59362_1